MSHIENHKDWLGCILSTRSSKLSDSILLQTFCPSFKTSISSKGLKGIPGSIVYVNWKHLRLEPKRSADYQFPRFLNYKSDVLICPASVLESLLVPRGHLRSLTSRMVSINFSTVRYILHDIHFIFKVGICELWL